jgi:hypothetical protein
MSTPQVMSQAASQAASQATQQVRAECDRPKRTQRVPFGVPQTKLGVTLEVPGHHLYWCNDAGGQLEQAQAGGYEFVTPREIGETRDGSQVKRLVGTNKDGSPLYAYLLKIKQEWHEEDKKQLAAIDDQFEKAIKRGTLFEEPGENRYNGGIKLNTNRT